MNFRRKILISAVAGKDVVEKSCQIHTSTNSFTGHNRVITSIYIVGKILFASILRLYNSDDVIAITTAQKTYAHADAHVDAHVLERVA